MGCYIISFVICYFLIFPKKLYRLLSFIFPDKNIKSHKDKSFPQNPKTKQLSDASFKVKVLFSLFPVKTLHQTPDLQVWKCHFCSPSPVLAHQSIFRCDLSASSVWLLLKGVQALQRTSLGPGLISEPPGNWVWDGGGLGPGRRTWEESQQAGEEEARHRWRLRWGCATQAAFLSGC